MKNNLFIQKSQVSTLSKNPNGLFDLKKWATNLLTDYGVIAGDPCCVSGSTGVSGNISEARYSVFKGIHASGTTAADATVLNYGVNVIEVASLSDKSVKLPQPVTGKTVKIINMTSTAIYVFPANPGGKINNLPIDTPLSIPPDGTTYEFVCTENPYPGNWNTINNPGTSSFAFNVSINHTHGVLDDIIVVPNGTTYSTSSVYVQLGQGGAFTLYPSSAAYFSLPQQATATYLKVYSNIIPSDLTAGYNNGIFIKRDAFYVWLSHTNPNQYTGVNTWNDETVFEQDITSYPYLTQVTAGPTPSSSTAANIGDDTTVYSEKPEAIFDQMGFMNFPNIVSNSYCNYRISIPASAATKVYKFYIVQEYM